MVCNEHPNLEMRLNPVSQDSHQTA